MASFLDLGLMQIFSGLFVFLLTYVIIWGVLTWRKWMGDQPGVYAMIAFAIAILVSVAEPTRNFIMFIAPWYVALALVIFFILFIMSMFGLTAEEDFPKIIKDSRAYTWILILAVVVFVAGLSFTFGQALLEAQPGTAAPADPGIGGTTASGSFESNVVNTLVHPKVLGMLIFFFIAAVAVYFLSQPAT